ncbi:MAG: manganese/zinc/iron transport system substrate-binding protein [Abditibacteriota bacterium]|nr:manganese/zinc/iron transport system substrate-binding protein [Abditibacteriota bacterium]
MASRTTLDTTFGTTPGIIFSVASKYFGRRLSRHTLWPVLLMSLLLAMVLAGCSAPTNKSGRAGAQKTYAGEGPLQLTATTGMVADLARNIGGSHVQVTQLMGAGVDPHLYKAKQSDIGALSEADMILYSGLHLEGKMIEVFGKLGRNKPVVPVAEIIPKAKLRQSTEFGGNPDPHVWFDVSLWMLAAQSTRDALIAFDPQHKAEYNANATKYLSELSALHRYAKTQLATVPKAQRVLITAHDAFGYFGAAYGVEVVGLQGISTASEYGLNDVQRLVNSIVQRRIKAVFVESSVPRRSIDAVVQGCRAKGHKVAIGGTLYSDAMGSEGTPAGTYTGMVKANVDTIVQALK